MVIEFLKASLKIDPFASLSGLRHKVKDAFGFEVSKELIRVVIKSWAHKEKNKEILQTGSCGRTHN